MFFFFFSFSAKGTKVGATMDLGTEKVELRSRGGRAELGAIRRAGGVINLVGPPEIRVNTNSSSIKGFTLNFKTKGSSHISELSS